MKKFIKYYSYNQFIESFDVLVMTDNEYLTNKDMLDNPQRVVLVKRAGGPKEPKMPQWFKQWNDNVYENRQPAWFKQWSKDVYEKQPPKWFTNYMEEFAKKNNLKL